MHTYIHTYIHTLHTLHTSHTCIQAIPLARNRYSGACGQRPKRLQMMLDTCHSARCECNTVRKHERRLFLLYCPSSQCCPERKQVKLLQQRLRRLAELRAEDLRCRGLTPPTMARCPESLAGPAAHWTRALPSWQPQRQPWKRPDEGCKASMHLWVPCTCCRPRPFCSTKPVRRPVSKVFASPLSWSCFSTSHISPALAMTSRGRRWCPTFGTHNGTRMANCCAWWSHWVGISAHALRWQLVSACRGVFRRCSVLQRAQNPGGSGLLPRLGRYHLHTCTHAHMHKCINAYMHTCIHAYMHTDIHTNIQTYKHTNIQTYKHTNIQTYKHTNHTIPYIPYHTIPYHNIPAYQHTNIPTYQHTYIHTYKHT